MSKSGLLHGIGAAGAFALCLAMGIGCGGGGDCETVYEAVKKCEGDKLDGMDKSKFVEMCNKAKSKEPEEFAALVKCAKEPSCEKMSTCEQAARGGKRAKKVAKYVADGKWKDAWEDCTFTSTYYANDKFKAECLKVIAEAPGKLTGEDLRSAGYACKNNDEVLKTVPELAKACQGMSAGALTTATAALTKARDSATRDYKACVELEDAAKQAGGDAVAKAKTLCDEADKAEDVKKTFDEAKANAAAKTADLPYQCRSLPDDLEKIGSEWAKQKRDELLKVCFVELGAVIIEVKSGDASKYLCPHAITQVLEAVTKYGLAEKHPEVAAMTANLPKKCKDK